MAEKDEIVEEGKTSYDNCSSTASGTSEPTSVTWSSKFASSLATLFRSSPTSIPGTIVRSAQFPSSSTVYSSTRIERMMQRRSEFATELEFEIEASRVHWSELESTSVEEQAGPNSSERVKDLVSTMGLDLSGSDDEAAQLTNAQIVQSLRRQWPDTGSFFLDYGDLLEVGVKIAEGAQAEIFEAKHAVHGGNFVLKVFKEGWSLRDLQRQWPHGMLQQPDVGYWSANSSPIVGGTVVMNGRFAFQMFRYWGDLRKLIDLRMQSNHNQNPPFSHAELKLNMLHIAEGMEGLHNDNIIHRDLKASNVLIQPNRKWEEKIDMIHSNLYDCHVADYECSVGVVGTGFWRAPEILRAMKNRSKMTSDLFTSQSDVYSYAMTCYEMITGQLPFEGIIRPNDYDTVIRGNRPMLPVNLEPWIKTLLSRCWCQDPFQRPNFQEIVVRIRSKIGIL